MKDDGARSTPLSAARHRGACCLVAVALTAAAACAGAHSNLSGFSGNAPAHAAHDDHAADAREQGPLHPGVVIVDPRQIESIVIKINARVVNMRALYVGKPVTQGEVLAELESAELITVQNTYLGILNNFKAVKAASVTAPAKLVEGRMTLQWRGMSAADIDRLEATRQPLQRIAIRAPATGYLYNLNVTGEQILNAGVQTGQFTAAGTAVASVARQGAVAVEAAVPVDTARTLRAGQNATVFIQATRRGWVPVKATVQAVSGLSAAASQRRVVRVSLREPATGLPYANGLAVTVAFEKERDAQAPTPAH